MLNREVHGMMVHSITAEVVISFLWILYVGIALSLSWIGVELGYSMNH